MNDSPRRGSLLVIFLTVFIDLLGFAMVLPLLPIYADRFTTDEAGWMLGALMASFSIMQFLFAPLWGRLSDRFGRRPVLMIGLAGSVVFYTIFGLATEYGSLAGLFIARIGAGIAGATVPIAQAYIADTTTLEKRARGMALIGMAFGLGFTFGPLLGFLAVPSGKGQPGPWPGYVAAALSAVALGLAVFKLPESLSPESKPAVRRVLDFASLRQSLAVPSVGALLITIFFCIFSFAAFETTVSLLIQGGKDQVLSPFAFSWGQICLTYAYIGFTLALVQGGLVRRLAGRLAEGLMASGGAVVQIAGFGLVMWAASRGSAPLLMVGLGAVVFGFAFLQPSLNSLLSRRSDPARQGGIMGLGQSSSSLGRIIGAWLGIPLLKQGVHLPYFTASGLMLIGLVLILISWRSGGDFNSADKMQPRT